MTDHIKVLIAKAINSKIFVWASVIILITFFGAMKVISMKVFDDSGTKTVSNKNPYEFPETIPTVFKSVPAEDGPFPLAENPKLFVVRNVTYEQAVGPAPKQDYEQSLNELAMAGVISDSVHEEPFLSGAIKKASVGFSNNKPFLYRHFHGRIPLYHWMRKNDTRINDLKNLPRTNHNLVMSNYKSELGKALCGLGNVTELEIVSNMFYIGTLFISGNMVRFLLVDSKADVADYEIVKYDKAQFCGIVTGIELYSPAGKKTTQAVRTVGILDIPAKR